MRLERKYEAEAAHQLSAGVPEGHPCRRLHGHRYRITVTLIGDVNPETGMLLEYAQIDQRVNEVLRFVDHRFINNLGSEPDYTAEGEGVAFINAGIKETELALKVRTNSTVEHLAAWFKAELEHRFPVDRTHVGVLAVMSPQVYAVRIEEDSRSAVEV
jgi:6-pyruvoyltetrahydropterin/6-carboxytetrahydropterin synthase